MSKPPPYPAQGAPGYPQYSDNQKQYVYTPQQPQYQGGQGFGYSYGTNSQPAGNVYNPSYSDVESGPSNGGLITSTLFEDPNIRRGFVRKVFGILTIQILVTVVVAMPFILVHDVKVFTFQNSWLFIVAMIASFVLMLVLVCCESVRRKSPLNYILLGIFTVLEGVTVGVVSATYDIEAVLMAMVICAGVTFGLTIFAMQTKIDFLSCGGVMFVVLMIFVLAGIMIPFFPSNKYVMIGYGSIGALIFSFYIVYDVQLMVGGKHKYALSAEEYIFASLNIYLDVINLFLMLLQIIGGVRSD